MFVHWSECAEGLLHAELVFLWSNPANFFVSLKFIKPSLMKHLQVIKIYFLKKKNQTNEEKQSNKELVE